MKNTFVANKNLGIRENIWMNNDEANNKWEGEDWMQVVVCQVWLENI